MCENETWLPIPLHSNYEVSNLGSVRSIDHFETVPPTGYTRFRKGRTLKPHKNADGYYIVRIDGKACRVHRLVARAFLGVPNQGLEVCHNDGVSLNNDVCNLRYDTRSENMLDKVRHGTHHNANKKTCIRGHKLDGMNIHRDRDRDCRSCAYATLANRRGRISSDEIDEASDFAFHYYSRGQFVPLSPRATRDKIAVWRSSVSDKIS